MSLINDALKRAKLAQHEPRAQHSAPGMTKESVLTPVEPERETARPPWFLWLAIAGAVGTTAFGSVLLWRGLFGVPPVPRSVALSQKVMKPQSDPAPEPAIVPSRSLRGEIAMIHPVPVIADHSKATTSEKDPIVSAPRATNVAHAEGVLAAPVGVAVPDSRPRGIVASAPALPPASRTVEGAGVDRSRPHEGGSSRLPDPTPSRGDSPGSTLLDANFSKRLQGIFFRLKRPTVMIDGKVLTIGSEIDGWKVEAIDRQSVTLAKGGRRHLMRME